MAKKPHAIHARDSKGFPYRFPQKQNKIKFGGNQTPMLGSSIPKSAGSITKHAGVGKTPKQKPHSKASHGTAAGSHFPGENVPRLKNGRWTNK